nr:hypothetical protein Iba_chr04cCG16020 [Ipomoea batatas]GMD01079.1 hypothetical protein Iba_chr05fCG4000 [Ipomoea batatas]GME07753.1 hypothetical protein Iba_scaffold6535CG0050 [Ipomoea batatas]
MSNNSAACFGEGGNGDESGSVSRSASSNQGSNNLTLKGWPLTVFLHLDHWAGIAIRFLLIGFIWVIWTSIRYSSGHHL